MSSKCWHLPIRIKLCQFVSDRRKAMDSCSTTCSPMGIWTLWADMRGHPSRADRNILPTSCMTTRWHRWMRGTEKCDINVVVQKTWHKRRDVGGTHKICNTCVARGTPSKRRKEIIIIKQKRKRKGCLQNIRHKKNITHQSESMKYWRVQCWHDNVDIVHVDIDQSKAAKCWHLTQDQNCWIHRLSFD